jgi:hypothetical protein
MESINSLRLVVDGATVLEWLLVGYLFYSVNPNIAMALFLTVGVGVVAKHLLHKEEMHLEKEFIIKLTKQIDEENEKLDNDKQD